jgi:hypothetical protein
VEKRNSVTARCVFICTTLLLSLDAVSAGGVYQRTRDGRTFIWNNYPSTHDEATWSGSRDSKGFATGYGTLTWYRVQRAIVTGSNIAPSRGSAVGGAVTNRSSGKMVRGKFDGPVVNVDARGKTFHGTFVNGVRTSDWVAGAPQRPDQQSGDRVSRSPSTAAMQSTTASPEPAPPAAGPSSLTKAASPQPPVQSTPPAPSPAPVVEESAVKNRMITDFKEQTQSVLSRVGDATGNFREIDRLDSVPQLPAPVSESVASLVDLAREFRAKVGYETALSECRTETETVDALSALDQTTRSIAGRDASAANSRLAEFLKNNPEPTEDGQKPLWGYLTSMRLLCSRLEKEAGIHSERAQAFASAGRTGDAIREYREAYRTFPNPTTAEKIRKLQRNSLGL